MKPRLLDAFSGAGGAGRGYQLAGFEVTGVDHRPMPRYAGDHFIQADALEFIAEHGREFDAIHASPPCQAFTTASNGWQSRLGDSSERHSDLLTPTRELLKATGVPWVIENVVGAPMSDYVVLCGSMFGLGVRRHRRFECSVFMWEPSPCHAHHDASDVIVFGGGVRGRAHQIGRTSTGKGGPIIRRPTLPLERGQQAMGIDWMDRHELSQAIPPAYTHFIGTHLMNALKVSA